MTRDEIQAMPAGTDLDRLVSEKVMKKTMFGFYPSKQISAAWEVVESLKSMGIYATIERLENDCQCILDGKIYTSAIGDTAPLAICRAALLAVMELA